MLVRLYSDTGLLLENVDFRPGINIILGKYSGDREASNINGIGKSSLVRLINYTLLCDRAKKIFSKPVYDFLREEKHRITLEFKVKGETFFIERDFKKEEKIYFGRNPIDFEEYTKGELKAILMDKLFPIKDRNIFVEGKQFRSLMSFFVKDDLDNQKRTDPLNFIAPTSLSLKKTAVYNFFLLDLPTKNIINYNEQVDEYEKYSKTIKNLKEKVKIDTGKSIEEFRSERLKIESNIELLEKSLTDYKFLDSYKNIEKQIVELTTKINDKLKEYHSHNRRLKKIKDSYQINQVFDTQEIKKLYNEVLSSFGDIVSKTLNDITEFKKKILENRNRYLITREKQLEKIISEILDEISRWEIQRSRLYKKLEEKGALESITNTYEQLISEKTSLERNLQTLKQLDEIQEMLGNLEVTISKVKLDISNDLKQYKKQQDELRGLFQEILTSAIFLEEDFQKAYFDISPKPNSQRNQLPFSIEVEIPKADALGQSRLKIVAYDLMLFLDNMRKGRELPDFLVHDGIYHGISRATVINTLNYIFRQCLKNPNFQYIATFNEDEIYIPGDRKIEYGTFDFDWKELLIAVYEDNPSKMIFKREFR